MLKWSHGTDITNMGQIIYSDIYCQGYESSLAECTYHTPWRYACTHYDFDDIIGVQCIPSEA